jgi:hypothetical protein
VAKPTLRYSKDRKRVASVSLPSSTPTALATATATAYRASADVSMARTETFNGREYTVVPVVALVEGVIQSMNSPQAEFVSADEFSRFCVGWNGRPVTMDHPQVNRSPVSANDPAVLSAYQIGIIFNAHCEDDKLLMEAWIDDERVQELSDASREVFEVLQAGELVEVSTGLYTSVVETEGRFNGQDYFGVWEGIVPDHLAILPIGVLGACSIEDGCGANRVNSVAALPGWRVTEPTVTHNTHDTHHGCGCEACTTGGKVMVGKSNTTTKAKVPAEAVTPDTTSPTTPADGTEEGTAAATTGTKKKAPKANAETEELPGWLSKVLSAVTGKPITMAQLQAMQSPPTFEPAQVLQDSILRGNGAPADMMSADISRMLSEEISEGSVVGGGYAYLVGYTADKVIYTVYSYDFGSETFQASYEISPDGSSCEIMDDSEAVNLITKIVPETDDANEITDNSDHARVVIEGESGEEVTETLENLSAPEGSIEGATEMANLGKPAGGTALQANATMSPAGAGGGFSAAPGPAGVLGGMPSAHVVQPQGSIAATMSGTGATAGQPMARVIDRRPGAPSALDQLLNNARAESPELVDMLEEGMRTARNRKDGLIQGLKASGRCKFSDEYLGKASIQDLEALAELANIPNYSGRAAALEPHANMAPETPAGQRTSNGMGVPAIEPIFTRKAV